MLGGAPARAATVEVAGLRLAYPDAWQRGSAAEEADDDSVILRQPEAADALSLYMPRRAVPLKLDAERFYQQLERKWRAQYGDAARIARHATAGREWRVCARPSVETRATVFHLVTVRAGRAHHVLAIGARDAGQLPAEVVALLDAAHWPEAAPDTPARDAVATTPPASPPAPAETRAEAAPTPSTPAMPRAEPPPAVAAPVEASAPASHPEPATQPTSPPETPALAADQPVRLLGPWRLLRAARVGATGPGLASLAQVEARRLGDAGMLLGYGLRLGDDSLHAFLDGYEFDPYVPGKAGRKPFAYAWQWSWRMPETWYPGIGLSLPLNRAAGDATQVAGAGWRIEALALCGPRPAMVRAFDALDRGEARAEALLDALACAGGARPLATASAAPPDATGLTTLALARLEGVPEKAAPGAVRRLLLSLGADQDAMPGAALLRGARFLYIYGPEEP